MTGTPTYWAETIRNLTPLARARVDSTRQGGEGGSVWGALATIALALLLITSAIGPAVATPDGDGSFHGTISVNGSPATDGSRYSYEISKLSAVSEPVVKVTGALGTETDTQSGGIGPNGGSFGINVAGTSDPTGPANGQPRVRVSSYTRWEDYDGTDGPGGLNTASYSFGGAPSTIREIKLCFSTTSSPTDKGWYYADIKVDGVTVVNDYQWSFISNREGCDTLSINAGTDGTANIDIVPYDNWDGHGYVESVRVMGPNPSGSVTVTADTGGSVSVGEGSSAPIDLSLSTSSISVGPVPDKGSATVSIDYTERQETMDATVSINGHETTYNGTLADDETATLPADASWIVEGTNWVNVSVGDGSLSADAPTPAVGLSYRHDAASTHRATQTAQHWLTDYSVEHTYASARDDARLELTVTNETAAIQSLTIQHNDGSVTPVPSTDYMLSGKTLEVAIGDVPANETVRINATAQTVRTNDGEIAVVEPTAPGSALDSKFKITEKGEDFYIALNDTRIHYLYDESWDAPGERSRVTNAGVQQLRVPNAETGSTARVARSALEVVPQTGDVSIKMEEIENPPRFRVEAGETGGDQVRYLWHDTTSNFRYTLWSLTIAGARGDPVTVGDEPAKFLDDDSAETLQINSGMVGGGSPIGDGNRGPLDTLLELGRGFGFVGIAIGAVIALFLIGDRYGDEPGRGPDDYSGYGLAGVGSLILIPVLIEVLNPGSISDRIGVGVSSALESALGPIGIIGVIGVIALGWMFLKSRDSDTTIQVVGSQKEGK